MAKTVKAKTTDEVETKEVASETKLQAEEVERYTFLQQKVASDLYKELLRQDKKRNNQNGCYELSRNVAQLFVETLIEQGADTVDVLASVDYLVIRFSQTNAPNDRTIIREALELHKN